MSITTDLDAIRARADAATEGPWDAVDLTPHRNPRIYWVETNLDTTDMSMCIAELIQANQGNDAEFIAHARTDVPFLLDLVDELRRQVKVWKGKAE